MKLSCLPVSYFPAIQAGEMSIRAWAAEARSVGLDSIDLSIMLVPNHTPTCIEKLKQDLCAEKMPITMITTYPDFTHPDPAQRAREMDYARHDIALASQLGAKYLRLVAGQAHPETSLPDGISWVVESFKQLEKPAARHKIQLLYENHSKPSAWKYFDFSQSTAVYLEVVEKIASTGIRLNFDTANPVICGDDSLSLLEKVISRVETLHVQDNAAKGVMRPVVPGHGIVPFAALFALLKAHGWDGWLCIEEGTCTGHEGVKEAVRFVRTLWNAG
jgi:sugar phosphate isomerase/epimerase